MVRGAAAMVSKCDSMAASLMGWRAATDRALGSAEMGGGIAAGAPRARAAVRARRWNALAGSNSNRNAWMPATAKPVAAYAAMVIWRVCWNAMGFSMAATGSILTGRPPTMSKPAG